MKERMNWDTLTPTLRCVVYSSFIKPKVFRVRIMVGPFNADGTDNNGPNSKPWKILTFTPCKSHIDAFHLAFRFAKNNYKEASNAND